MKRFLSLMIGAAILSGFFTEQMLLARGGGGGGGFHGGGRGFHSGGFGGFHGAGLGGFHAPGRFTGARTATLSGFHGVNQPATFGRSGFNRPIGVQARPGLDVGGLGTRGRGVGRTDLGRKFGRGQLGRDGRLTTPSRYGRGAGRWNKWNRWNGWNRWGWGYWNTFWWGLAFDPFWWDYYGHWPYGYPWYDYTYYDTDLDRLSNATLLGIGVPQTSYNSYTDEEDIDTNNDLDTNIDTDIDSNLD